MLVQMRETFTALLLGLLLASGVPAGVEAHDAKDFDDSILYNIDFEMPDFDKNPELRSQLKTFYTHEKEKYDCVIPVMDDSKEVEEPNKAELAPYIMLQPLASTHSCSYRIEAYWSYEICHGYHVRQYHEEREGKNVKFQEYYLGVWNEKRQKEMEKNWEENHKSGMKYKTIKIDNTKYPYFEVEMSDGTMCNIINAPRTTIIRYVCYPHGKNEIYSFKETSSCNYEAIILTPMLCMIPGFVPEESKEVSIKCFNSPTEPHKPLSMLRQELNDLQISEDDFPTSKEDSVAATALTGNERLMLLNALGGRVDKLVLELMAGAGVDVDTELAAQQSAAGEPITKALNAPITDLSPIREFISGKNCLTGGTGWWKYEFCYGRHVRQFHKDKKSETELFLGYFSESAHRQWVSNNPDKAAKRQEHSGSLWHHYEQGTRCDRTGLPREVDVKLTCTLVTNSATTVSMYLLEPKTCQYILVVESPIVCELTQIADEFGLVQEEKLQKLLQGTDDVSAAASGQTSAPTQDRVDSVVGIGSVSEALPPEDVQA